jgi:hypothetical protein
MHMRRRSIPQTDESLQISRREGTSGRLSSATTSPVVVLPFHLRRANGTHVSVHKPAMQLYECHGLLSSSRRTHLHLDDGTRDSTHLKRQTRSQRKSRWLCPGRLLHSSFVKSRCLGSSRISTPHNSSWLLASVCDSVQTLSRTQPEECCSPDTLFCGCQAV